MAWRPPSRLGDGRGVKTTVHSTVHRSQRVGSRPPPLPPPDASRRGFLRWGWQGSSQSRGGQGTCPALAQRREKSPPKQDAFIPLFVYKVCSGHLPYVGFTELLGQMLGTPGMGMRETRSPPSCCLLCHWRDRQRRTREQV